ncbi:protease modulator HflC [Sphingomonas sp. AOB5]|uniref:protease modulator HflC n=1 Tax=Sphingomonas sp. AOB5 TaxID=3034017 RepID=UPI0023F6C3BA|nr:protease modulator HflC [Sphingomonas sp. AOB5]MDF7775176.1 protease modulator HflC [Sphingomonas sp. AOB5]
MSNSWYRNPITLGGIALAVLLLVFSSFVVVPETKQAVILRMNTPYGAPINAYQPGQRYGQTGAGVIFRIPFLDQVVWVDKRVLDIELQNQPVLSTDQLRLEVDAFARFRVVDPLLMWQTAKTEAEVISRLEPLFGSALRNELGRVPFATLLSPERGQVMDNIQSSLQKLAAQYGVEIVDVRIKHADLPTGSPLDSAFERMRTARRQEAATIRAQGFRDAQIIRANAEAERSRIYAAAFNKDPEFYGFFRAMQSYRYTFVNDQTNKGSTSIILSPQNSYLREFMGQR